MCNPIQTVAGQTAYLCAYLCGRTLGGRTQDDRKHEVWPWLECLINLKTNVPQIPSSCGSSIPMNRSPHIGCAMAVLTSADSRTGKRR